MVIGNTNLKHGLLLAPMAGFSDRALRYVARLHGAEMSTTEMVSAKAVCYNDEKTFRLARILGDEGSVSVQIFGSEPSIMAQAAAKITELEYGGERPVAIDINMGCPVKKIFTNNEGAALMAHPDLIYKIVNSVSEAIDIPCTVKMRVGIDENSKNAIECALAAEAGGASMIALHGRTRAALYSGKIDKETIKSVKEAVKIPLVANGDIMDAKSALEMLYETGADGIMIGRGALGNPFIFEEIKCALEEKNYSPPSLEERSETALLQLRVAIEDKGEQIAVREARGQIAFYLKGFRGAARLRGDINRAVSYRDVEMAFLECLKSP